MGIQINRIDIFITSRPANQNRKQGNNQDRDLRHYVHHMGRPNHHWKLWGLSMYHRNRRLARPMLF